MIRLTGFTFISFLLFIFSIAKVTRGVSFETSTQGGFWNFISLLYYPIVFFIVLNNRFVLMAKPVFIVAFLYLLFALLSAVINFRSIDLLEIYSFLMIPNFFLIMVSFYELGNSTKMSRYLIGLAFVICLAINLFSVLQYQILGARRPLASDIYYSLCLFPFILIFTHNRITKIIIFFLVGIAMFFSGKRTGMIAFVLGTVTYIVVSQKIKKSLDFKSIVKVLVTLIIVLSLFYLITNYLDTKLNLKIYDRIKNLFIDGGSGRDELYVDVWRLIQNSSITEILIGHGVYATEKMTGFFAHNDFLEILFDYGIVSLLLILLFYYQLFSNVYEMIRLKSQYAPAFALSIVIGFILSMFSYLIVFYT